MRLSRRPLMLPSHVYILTTDTTLSLVLKTRTFKQNAGDDIDLGGAAQPPAPPSFEDEEEDLAVKEKAEAERMASVQLKKKGNALQMKKDAEENRRIEEEAARKAMEVRGGNEKGGG